MVFQWVVEKALKWDHWLADHLERVKVVLKVWQLDLLMVEQTVELKALLKVVMMVELIEFEKVDQ